MANPKHLKIMQQGVERWNAWRQKNPTIAPDLSLANLEQRHLFGVDLRDSDLRGANLLGANLIGADFIREERHIGDFTNPTRYPVSLERLLRDLQAQS